VVTDYNHPEKIGIAEPLRFPRLALAFHAYSSHQESLVRELVFERAATQTDQPGGPPLLMDEFGGSRHADSIAATADLADAAGLSWSYWSALELHDPTGNAQEGLINQTTRRPYVRKAWALAVAYPAATAGTPGPWSFSRSSARFVYSYAVDHAIRAPTEIELPRYTYPHGYRVHIRGARVLSPSGSTVLELRATRRASTVSVTVTRRG
jgi:endoglycosylceramidase